MTYRQGRWYDAYPALAFSLSAMACLPQSAQEALAENWMLFLLANGGGEPPVKTNGNNRRALDKIPALADCLAMLQYAPEVVRRHGTAYLAGQLKAVSSRKAG